MCPAKPPPWAVFVETAQSPPALASPVNSRKKSVVVCGRSVGFFASACITADLCRGLICIPIGVCSKGRGGCVRCFVAHSHGVLASKGSTPVSIS